MILTEPRGRDMGLISAGNATAVIAAGLLSVILFSPGALALLKPAEDPGPEVKIAVSTG